MTQHHEPVRTCTLALLFNEIRLFPGCTLASILAFHFASFGVCSEIRDG